MFARRRDFLMPDADSLPTSLLLQGDGPQLNGLFSHLEPCDHPGIRNGQIACFSYATFIGA